MDINLISLTIKGDLIGVKDYLKKNPNKINELSSNNNNALVVAADRGYREIFDFLLDETNININNQNNKGQTALFESINNPSLYYTARLLEKNANPNISNVEDITPLIYACYKEDIDKIKALTSSKDIDINYTNKDSKISAFSVACSEVNEEIIKHLVFKGVNINALNKEGYNGLITVFTGWITSRKKIRNGEKGLVEIVRFLIDNGINIDLKTKNGLSPFWYAANIGIIEIIKKMLSKNPNIDALSSYSMGSIEQKTALHFLLMLDNKDVVQKILENNKNIDLKTKDGEGVSYETYGFLNKTTRQLMFDYNADINCEYKNIPIFSYMISEGDKNIDIIKKFIKKGVKISGYGNRYEPICIAIKNNSIKTIKTIVETGKVNLNEAIKLSEENNQTYSPLMYLSLMPSEELKSLKKNIDLYEKLIEANEINKKNNVKSSILKDEDFNEINEKLNILRDTYDKICKNQIDILNYLISSGADVNLENNEGNTALFLAERKDIYDELIKNKANIFHVNKKGQDLLLYSVINNSQLVNDIRNDFKNHSTIKNIFYQIAFEKINSNLQQINIEKGIMSFLNKPEIKSILGLETPLNINEINFCDVHNNSPLIVASANNNQFLCRLFLNLGANIDHQNNEGETALMHAVVNENEKLVEFLLNKKANINLNNKNNQSLLDLAELTKNENIIKLINEKKVNQNLTI